MFSKGLVLKVYSISLFPGGFCGSGVFLVEFWVVWFSIIYIHIILDI